MAGLIIRACYTNHLSSSTISRYTIDVHRTRATLKSECGGNGERGEGRGRSHCGRSLDDDVIRPSRLSVLSDDVRAVVRIGGRRDRLGVHVQTLSHLEEITDQRSNIRSKINVERSETAHQR